MKNIFALILLISLLPASGYSEEVVSKKYFVKILFSIFSDFSDFFFEKKIIFLS